MQLVILYLLTTVRKSLKCSNPVDTSFLQNNMEYSGEGSDDNDEEAENTVEEDEKQQVAEDIKSTSINCFQNTRQKRTEKI